MGHLNSQLAHSPTRVRPSAFFTAACCEGFSFPTLVFASTGFNPPGMALLPPHGVALQVAFERQTLKPVFSLDRLQIMGLKGYRLWATGQLDSTCRAPPRWWHLRDGLEVALAVRDANQGVVVTTS
jgi:hypothetical protein